MKVLHIITGLDVGGAELMLRRLVQSHYKNGDYSHSVISLTCVGKIGQELQAIGIEVRALEMHSLLDVPRALFQLVRHIRESRSDIVQTWLYHADLLGGLAARLARNRNVIWGVRTTEVTVGGRRSTMLVRQLCAALSRFVPHSIVCAAESSRRVHVDAGYDRTRMVVVPNGFDLSWLVATNEKRVMLRSQCGFAPSDVVIGSLGRFNPVKDHENFVRAATLVATARPEVKFLMIGRDLDANNAVLISLIAATGTQERFILLGERSDVPACLSAMDIFCLHSRTEGFPNVVGEAMAMALPCVVTDVGDAAVLVADKGVVVPKEDPAALAHGLMQLVDMPVEKRRELGQRAKVRIQAEFTIDRARENYEAIYQHVLAQEVV